MYAWSNVKYSDENCFPQFKICLTGSHGWEQMSRWEAERQRLLWQNLYQPPPITNIGFLRVFNQLVRTEQIDLMGEEHERFLGLFVSLVVCLKQLGGFNGTQGNHQGDWLADFTAKSQTEEKMILNTIVGKISCQNSIKTWKCVLLSDLYY